MANQYPYFRWFPADAEMDRAYAAMSFEERGLYLTCLNMAWVNRGLPADEEEIRRLVKASPEEFTRMWPRVSRCFEERDGLLVNPRLEKEREYVNTMTERASAAAQARHRRSSPQAEPKHCSSTAQALLKQDASSADALPRAYDSDSVSGSSSVSSSSVQEIPDNAVKGTVTLKPARITPRFGEWLAGFRGRKAKPDEAARAWISVDAEAAGDAPFACRDRYNRSAEVARGATMEAAKFIFEQGRNQWTGDWPRAPDPSQTVAERRTEQVRVGFQILDHIRRGDGV